MKLENFETSFEKIIFPILTFLTFLKFFVFSPIKIFFAEILT